MIIAVDGPAASGKGTLAKRLAVHYGFGHLDTGRMYRAVALAMIDAGAALGDEAAALDVAAALSFERLDAPELATPDVGAAASRIATNAALRGLLVSKQRQFAQRAAAEQGGAVLDGRDIGTVVCPDAAVKLYIVADVEERARRRALEAFGRADGADYAKTLADLEARDARDAGRETGPLRQAEDAHRIDTTALDSDAVFARALHIVGAVHAHGNTPHLSLKG